MMSKRGEYFALWVSCDLPALSHLEFVLTGSDSRRYCLPQRTLPELTPLAGMRPLLAIRHCGRTLR